MSVEDPLADLREAYRGLAIAADIAPNPRVQHKRFNELHKVHKKLRSTQEGRLVIESLLADEAVSVRGWAAAHCLMWNPQAARPVLEDIRDGDEGWALDAKYTLIEFEAGRLHFDF